MPILTILGAPHRSPLHLDPAVPAITKAVAEALSISTQDVTIAIPTMANNMLDLVVEVRGIFAKPERTPELLRELWKKVIDILEFYNDDRHGDRIWRKIEVIPDQPIQGDQVVFREYPPRG